jgi:flavin-dependent dehydrogenase
MSEARDSEIAVVGGGPAGSVVAALLARRGHDVVLFERTVRWRWRACGVFSSPITMRRLERLGLATDEVRASARPIPAMRVEAPNAPPFRLTYGDDGSLAAPALGFDRQLLDEALLGLAAEAGADVRRGTSVHAVELPDGGERARLSLRGGDAGVVSARIVVGADGPRSVVARAAGVGRPARIAARVGLTYHVRDQQAAEPHDARMVVLRDGGYCGLAPVPGGRVNVGIVLDARRWTPRLRRYGAAGVAAGVLEQVGAAAEPCDAVAGIVPVGHRVTRRAGAGWLRVGDGAGFLDPFTGEGLGRAVRSAELAADAVAGFLAARRGALPDYDRAMRRTFAAKDIVSLVVQGFVARPALFGYAARRLAARERIRETMGLVIGDLVPASRALDPRFLAALLAP